MANPYKTTDAKILIVDDDPYIVRLLCVFLKTEGFTNVSFVNDPRQAIDEYKRLNPDLVILDIFMPHIDGFAVMEQIKQVAPDSHNVLILTCLDEPATRARALACGARDVLGKPFERGEAMEKVRAALAGRHR